MTHTLSSHCHSTAVALEDFWPAVGSPSYISISPIWVFIGSTASLPLHRLIHVSVLSFSSSLTLYYDAAHEDAF